MAYTALYRKFRPLTFGEIVGQEHITKTLKNQLISNRVGHAYLFNGCRGTGKTSAAKILARAVNCLNPKDGEPCNECEICKAALSGSLTDIVEMDAASNNSVEDIRLIRDEVNFLPTLAKYRVYIIDEVHMLSTGAFNALLKTLEEPPAHVKFILATTEPQKLPATILSRCQRFDFKKLSNENIVKRLNIVCNESKINVEESALKIIASLSEVTYIEQITESVIKKDVETVLKVIKEVIVEGKDQGNFLWEVIKYVKDLLLYKVTGETGIHSEKEVEKLKEISTMVEKEELVHLIYELSELENNMKWSSQKTIMLEAGFIKLCDRNNMGQSQNNGGNITHTNNADVQELQRRVFKLEDYISKLARGNTARAQVQTQAKPQNVEKIVPKPASPESIKNNSFWREIIGRFKEEKKMMLYANLLNTTVSEINDMTVGINFKNGLNPLSRTILEKPENINEIQKQVSIAYGKDMKVKFIDNKANEPEPVSGIEGFIQDMDLPIDIIEE